MLVRPELNSRPLAWQPGAQPTEPPVRLEPVAKSKKVLTLDAWFNCFHVFVGIYCQKYPTEGPALMKYGEVVQDLAARGAQLEVLS